MRVVPRRAPSTGLRPSLSQKPSSGIFPILAGVFRSAFGRGLDLVFPTGPGSAFLLGQGIGLPGLGHAEVREGGSVLGECIDLAVADTKVGVEDGEEGRPKGADHHLLGRHASRHDARFSLGGP
jgi:hypothetical protein